MVNPVIRKQCPKRDDHVSHRWWSRKRRCYFQCGGREHALCIVCHRGQARPEWKGTCGVTCHMVLGSGI